MASLCQKQDPRIALASAIVYSLAVAILTKPQAVLFAAMPPIVLLLGASANWSALYRRLRAPLVFILLLAPMLPFTTPGEPIWQWGFLAPSGAGLALALLVCLKCLALLAVFAALLAPLSSSGLAAALHAFHCPWQLAAMFLLMDMNIHIVTREWKALKTAAKLRGFQAGTNLRSYRALAAMLALLLGRAAGRAKRAHEGMLLRGFDGHFPATQLPPLKIHNFLFLALVFLLACATLFLNCENYGFPL